MDTQPTEEEKGGVEPGKDLLTDGRCNGTTQSGERCKRRVTGKEHDEESWFCDQHKGQLKTGTPEGGTEPMDESDAGENNELDRSSNGTVDIANGNSGRDKADNPIRDTTPQKVKPVTRVIQEQKGSAIKSFGEGNKTHRIVQSGCKTTPDLSHVKCDGEITSVAWKMANDPAPSPNDLRRIDPRISERKANVRVDFEFAREKYVTKSYVHSCKKGQRQKLDIEIFKVAYEQERKYFEAQGIKFDYPELTDESLEKTSPKTSIGTKSSSDQQILSLLKKLVEETTALREDMSEIRRNF